MSPDSAVEGGYVFTASTRAVVAASNLQKIFDLGTRRYRQIYSLSLVLGALRRNRHALAFFIKKDLILEGRRGYEWMRMGCLQGLVTRNPHGFIIGNPPVQNVPQSYQFDGRNQINFAAMELNCEEDKGKLETPQRGMNMKMKSLECRLGPKISSKSFLKATCLMFNCSTHFELAQYYAT